MSGILVNDIHSQINATRVARVIEPISLNALVDVVRAARTAGAQLSLCGGRHAMGGQQFGTDAWLIDLRRHARTQPKSVIGERCYFAQEAAVVGDATAIA